MARKASTFQLGRLLAFVLLAALGCKDTSQPTALAETGEYITPTTLGSVYTFRENIYDSSSQLIHLQTIRLTTVEAFDSFEGERIVRHITGYASDFYLAYGHSGKILIRSDSDAAGTWSVFWAEQGAFTRNRTFGGRTFRDSSYSTPVTQVNGYSSVGTPKLKSLCRTITYDLSSPTTTSNLYEYNVGISPEYGLPLVRTRHGYPVIDWFYETVLTSIK